MQAHIIDELDAISLKLRHRDQPIEQPDARADDRSWTGVRMRRETFPINIGIACPQRQTDRWATVVRS